MIDEATAEDAALYVFHLLDEEEARAFVERMETDGELRQHVIELEQTMAQVAHQAPPRALPPGLEQRILQEIHEPVEARLPGNSDVVVRGNGWGSLLGWGIAALLAVGCFRMNQVQRRETAQQMAAQERLEQQILSLRREHEEERRRTGDELAALRARGHLDRLQIATLSAKLAQAANVSAVVVWNGEEQNGVLQLRRMPQASAGHDYQLWVIDPHYPQPVSAGVFTPEEARPVAFHAVQPIASAAKFAVSLEAKGGVQGARGPAGPIVLLSD